MTSPRPSSPSGRSPPSRWRRSWADNVKKAGGNPDVAMKELKAELAKYKAAY